MALGRSDGGREWPWDGVTEEESGLGRKWDKVVGHKSYYEVLIIFINSLYMKYTCEIMCILMYLPHQRRSNEK